MRFEQQLVFIASNEWVDEYINYTALKAAVYRAEKEALVYRRADHDQQQDEEQATLLGHGGGPGGAAGPSDSAGITPDTLSARFKTLLDAELAKIEKFYSRKQSELVSELEQVRDEIQQVEEEGQFGDFEDESDEESGESDHDDGTGAAKLFKKSTKLLKSVVGAGASSSGHHHHHANRRRSSAADGDNPSFGHRRTGSTSSGKLRRQRSHTASEGSNSSSTDALGRVTSRDMPTLPAEVTEDIESQINRTMQAATRPSSPTDGKGGGVQAQPPFSPTGPAPLRRRASSFGDAMGKDVSTADIWNSRSRAAQDMRITFKMRLQSLFREFSQLKEYVTLNQSKGYNFHERHMRQLISPITLYSRFQEDSEEV